jgi:hypothetical protein
MEHAFAHAGAIGWYCIRHRLCQHDPVTWRDVDVEHAVDLQLPLGGVEGPMNELGERCPWPWDPQQLVGVPMGQYHCPYCGGMNVAGIPHLEWTPESIAEMERDLYDEQSQQP